MNPNTATAPVFRTRRDADITRDIYRRQPVLASGSGSSVRHVWPFKFLRMFDMTNDSSLFYTAAQLEEKGYYRVKGNRWQKGEKLYLPLYQGRMIWQFDHRANSVRVNLENLHNPHLSEGVTTAQHADPDFSPQPQYWATAANVDDVLKENRGYTLAFRGIARPTDARTMVASILPWGRLWE